MRSKGSQYNWSCMKLCMSNLMEWSKVQENTPSLSTFLPTENRRKCWGTRNTQWTREVGGRLAGKGGGGGGERWEEGEEVGVVEQERGGKMRWWGWWWWWRRERWECPAGKRLMSWVSCSLDLDHPSGLCLNDHKYRLPHRRKYALPFQLANGRWCRNQCYIFHIHIIIFGIDSKCFTILNWPRLSITAWSRTMCRDSTVVTKLESMEQF